MIYSDIKRSTCLEIVNELLTNYFSVCKALVFENNKQLRDLLMVETERIDEQLIDKILIPKLEKILEDEMKEGTAHEFAYEQSNGKTVLYIDGKPYCSSKALDPTIEKQMELLQPIGNRINGRTLESIIIDTKVTLQDFATLRDVDFIERYKPVKELNGSTQFIQSLLEKIDTNPVIIGKMTGDTYTSGKIKNASECLLNVMQFVGKSGKYRVSFQDGKMMLNNFYAVDEINIFVDFHRRDKNESFVMDKAVVKMSNLEEGTSVDLETLVNEELGRSYGKIFTEVTYDSLCRKMKEPIPRQAVRRPCP